MLSESKDTFVKRATLAGLLAGGVALPTIMLSNGAAPDTWVSWIVMGAPLGALFAWAVTSAVLAVVSSEPKSVQAPAAPTSDKPRKLQPT